MPTERRSEGYVSVHQLRTQQLIPYMQDICLWTQQSNNLWQTAHQTLRNQPMASDAQQLQRH